MLEPTQRRTISQPKGSTAMVLIASLLITSCHYNTSHGPSAKQRAEAVVRELEAIPDATKRAAAAALTLNALCSLSRVAAGKADGPLETVLLAHYSALQPDVKEGVVATGDAIRAIPAAKRTALLGRFAAHDPGSCDAAPNWPAIRADLQLLAFPVPRLRANYCSGGFTYADATPADRAITSAHHSYFTIEGQGQVAPGASPVILGVEGEHVTARHPALQATTHSPIENGISPYGIETDIPCSPASDSCDASQGLICGWKVSAGPHCVAFPVVQKDQDLVLRGYNFWDVTDAQLVLTPLLSGQGFETATPVDFVDTNEPLDGATACPPASAPNPTHNRAHFRIGANEGHFYKVRLYNHNGTFHTEQDAVDTAPPRVVHVCYPTALGDVDVPAGTIRDCSPPPETCPQDGAACSGTWTTPPRKLDQCRHLPNQPVVCGETPEWFGNEPLTERTDAAPPVGRDAVVYVIGDEPKYELHASLDAIECKDETGWTDGGSDEPLMLIAGFPMSIPPGTETDLLDKIDGNADSWTGGDFDSGDREHPHKLLSNVKDIRFDSTVIYFVALAEDDEYLIGFLVGVALIVGIAAIIYLTGGAAFWVALGASTLASAAWAGIMSSISGSDLIGRTTLEVTPTRIAERIGADHAPDFLSGSPHAFDALPALAGAAVDHQRAHPGLVHPFADSPIQHAVLRECDPGACSGGKTCLVNRCVDPGFVDPIASTGFKERREFWGSDGYYAVDLLWEKVPSP